MRGRERTFTLERIGGRRRAVVESGGAELCLCVYLGPTDGGVDLVGEAGAVRARIRGGTMRVPDFRVDLDSGERLRLYGGSPGLVVESDRKAPTEVRVEEAREWRVFTWRADAAIGGVLRVRPGAGAEPWSLEVPGWEDPLRSLALLHAAERFLRERDLGS